MPLQSFKSFFPLPKPEFIIICYNKNPKSVPKNKKLLIKMCFNEVQVVQTTLGEIPNLISKTIVQLLAKAIF